MDAASHGDATVDAADVVDAFDAADAPETGWPCKTWSLGGIGMPPGTVATASTSYTTYTPNLAIDGDLTTNWNASDYTAWLQLVFPSAMAITGIHFAAQASPATNTDYTITALGSSTVIGSATYDVTPTQTTVVEPPISVTPGTYNGIVITVNGEASWVVLAEVSLTTAECP